MTHEEKVSRLTSLWLNVSERITTEADAEAFVVMWNEMKKIEEEEAEEQRIEHARRMSQPERYR